MPLIDATDSLLLVVDAQTDFYPRERTDVDQRAKEAALDVVAWVCGVADALDVPVVVTEEDAATNGPTAAQIRARLPQGAQVFDKTVFGAADNSPIAEAVRVSSRRTVVLLGMETDVCVAQSALGFAALGLTAVVVRDAVFSAGAAHDHGLKRLAQEGIALISAKELYYDWVHDLASARAFEHANPELVTPPGFSL